MRVLLRLKRGFSVNLDFVLRLLSLFKLTVFSQDLAKMLRVL